MVVASAELIGFAVAALLFAIAMCALIVWTTHKGHPSPVSPKRQGLRIYRELSPMEFAVAADRDPATCLVVAVIDLVQSGKAVVTGFAPLKLGPGQQPLMDAREQRVVEAFGMGDLSARGDQLLEALEDTCEALAHRMEGHSVGLTLWHYKRHCRRILGMITHKVGGMPAPEAIDRDLPWLLAADGAWDWADDLGRYVKTDIESAEQMLLQGVGLDANTCGEVLSILALLRREVIRVDDVVSYLRRHGDGQYMRADEIGHMMREGLRTSCSDHPEKRATRLCRLCHKPVCSTCFSSVHRCCRACAFPHVRFGEDKKLEIAPEFSAAPLPDYVKRIAPGLLPLGFRPVVDSRYQGYVDLAEDSDAIFTNVDGSVVGIICVAQFEAFAARDIEPFLERIYETVRAFPSGSTAAFLYPFGVLVLLASTPVAEERVRDTMALCAGQSRLGVIVQPWVVDLGTRKVHAHPHFDGAGELSTRDVATVLKEALP